MRGQRRGQTGSVVGTMRSVVAKECTAMSVVPSCAMTHHSIRANEVLIAQQHARKGGVDLHAEKGVRYVRANNTGGHPRLCDNSKDGAL